MGIAIRGQAAGASYNTITNPWIYDCLYGVHISENGIGGWANAQNIYGGLVTWSSTNAGEDMSAGAALHFVHDDTTSIDLNSINVYGTALEAATPTGSGKRPRATRLNGLCFQLHGVRFEGFISPYIEIQGSSAYNLATPAFPGHAPVDSFIYYNDRNKINIVANRENSIAGGSATYPVLGVYARSSGYRGIQMFESLGTAATWGVAGSGVMTLADSTTIRDGSGTPEGSVTATVGSLYLRTNGGDETSLYIKESGSGNTGWSAVKTGGQPVYAEGYVEAGLDTIEIDVAGGFRRVPVDEGGITSGFTVVQDSIAIVATAGVYVMNYDMSLTLGSTADAALAGVRVNATVKDDGRTKATIGVNGDEINLAGHTLLSLSAGDTISVVLTNTENANDIVLNYSNFSCWLLR